MKCFCTLHNLGEIIDWQLFGSSKKIIMQINLSWAQQRRHHRFAMIILWGGLQSFLFYASILKFPLWNNTTITIWFIPFRNSIRTNTISLISTLSSGTHFHETLKLVTPSCCVGKLPHTVHQVPSHGQVSGSLEMVFEWAYYFSICKNMLDVVVREGGQTCKRLHLWWWDFTRPLQMLIASRYQDGN